MFAVNPFHSGYISLVYVDESKPEPDNIVRLFDVRNIKDVNEPNPDLPTYHVNCWKEFFADSKPLPPDHPAYDHPHQKTHDEQGQRIPVARPAYDADIEAHQGSQQYAVPMGELTFNAKEGIVSSGPIIPLQVKSPSAADLDAVAADQAAAEATSGAPAPDAPPAPDAAN